MVAPWVQAHPLGCGTLYSEPTEVSLVLSLEMKPLKKRGSGTEGARSQHSAIDGQTPDPDVSVLVRSSKPRRSNKHRPSGEVQSR
jgi:hypothetical protein